MRDSLTLTHYVAPGSKTPYVTIEAAERAGVDAFPVEFTYRVGRNVRVLAFGRWRPGIVTKLGRTLVTVDYLCNQQGGHRTRAFGSGEILPGWR
jgi:hypothetical protein